MRLGVATTILAGASLILSGQIDFMLLFLFLLVITRVYAPFDQSLALIAELFVSQVSADRMNEDVYKRQGAPGAQHLDAGGGLVRSHPHRRFRGTATAGRGRTRCV